MTRARGVLAALLATVLLLGACSDDDGGGTPSATDVLTTLADEVIIPSYEALVINLEALRDDIDVLCTTPGQVALDDARAQWRDADLAWASTRAGGVGPAMTRRLMGSVAFRARPEDVEALLASDAAVDRTGLAAQGAAVRGISAIEVTLFADAATSLLTTDGARRCEYARSATELAREAGQEVLDDWTGAEPYRATFIAGKDGDPQSSVDALVNEVTFRLQELDDLGLRTLAAAGSFDELPAQRREGPGAYGIAFMRGVFGGVLSILLGPDGDGIITLVRDRSADTADRLEGLLDDASGALSALPDSMAASFDDPTQLAAASEAMAALKVLVGTEVASELGITIGFSDADGDA